MSYKLINSPLTEFVCKIYSVSKLQTETYKDIVNKYPIYFPYVIVKEYILPLPSQYVKQFDLLSNIISSFSYELYGGITKNFIEACKNKRINVDVLNWYLNFHATMIKNNIFIDDLHGDNVGTRSGTEFVIFDIGVSRGGEKLNTSHDVNLNEKIKKVVYNK
jgi:hypothetical protein